MGLPQIVVFFPKLTDLIIKPIYLFNHPQLIVAVHIEILLNLSALLSQTIVEYFYFVLIIPLNLLKLETS
jgi:hypothetical protein